MSNRAYEDSSATTAHPTGCAASTRAQIARARPLDGGPSNALIVGASGGYGLASRIVSAFGAGARTLGISLEKAPTERRTATAGWYNNAAFEDSAAERGLYAATLDGDAFSDEMKSRAIEEIRSSLRQIDLLVYSVAAPVRRDPRTGETFRSSIKPLGEPFHVKTLNQGTGEVHEADLEPATEEETAATVAVMGGEDWEYWIEALNDANVLAPGFRTVAYTYIGSELTWPIYWQATLGKAKEDLDRAAAALRERLAALDGGRARRGAEGGRDPGQFRHPGRAALPFRALPGHEGRRQPRGLPGAHRPAVPPPASIRTIRRGSTKWGGCAWTISSCLSRCSRRYCGGGPW